jgi:probable rRNA maturation factor
MIQSSDKSAPPARARPRSRQSRRAIRIEVVEDSGDWRGLEPVAPVVDRLVRAAADHLPGPVGPSSATLVLASDARVRALNRQWRGKDSPTNVLSFPAAPVPGKAGRRNHAFLGDIVLAAETLLREAAEAGIEPSHHFQHLVLHGLLHLLGFDHQTEDEADVMEGLEIRVLAVLGIANPFADRRSRRDSMLIAAT